MATVTSSKRQQTHTSNTYASNSSVTVGNGSLTLQGTGRIQGVDTVSATTDAANKAYVDAQVGAFDTLQEVTDNGNTTTNSIGIGTTNPTNKLDIRQSTSSGSDVLGVGAITIGSDNPYWTFRGTATSLQDLAFDRSYSGTWYESMRIQRSTGNVGIGTTNPADKLHVYGGRIAVDNLASQQSAIRFFSAGTEKTVLYRPSNSDDFRIYKSGISNDAFTILNSNGNIGIGTNSPATRLHVLQSGTAVSSDGVSSLVVQKSAAAGTAAAINIVSGDSAEASLRFGDTTDQSMGALRYFNDVDAFSIVTNNAEQIRITSSGNVGIGTTSPDTKLQVAGTIKASTHSDAIAIGSPTTVKWKMGVYGANDLLIRDASNNTRLAILSGGDVGIGTASPATKLQISSTMTSAPTSNIFLDVDGSNVNGGGGSIVFGTSISGSLTQYNAKITGTRASGGSGGDSSLGFWTTLASSNIAPLERMTITKEGKVGIGTTSPTEKLNIDNGNLRFDGNYSGYGIFASSNGSNNTFSFTRQDGVNTADLSISGYGGVGLTGGRVTSPATSGYDLYVKNGGNVGIGTTSPQQKLHVYKSNAPAGIEIQGGLTAITAVGDVHSFIDFGANDSSVTGGIAGRIESVAEYDNGAHNGLAFYTGKQSRTPYLQKAMQIRHTGAISFGSGSATYGSSGQILKSNGDASPTWVAASTVIGGPYLPLAGGTMTGTGSITMPDNFKLQLGNGIFSIFNDSTYSIIRSANEPLLIDANDITFRGYSPYNSLMTIKSTGKVGIGTTNPTKRLDVRNNVAGDYAYFGGSTDGGQRGLVLSSADNGIYLGAIHDIDATSGSGILTFSTATTERMRIDSSGNVSIGTASVAAANAAADDLHLKSSGSNGITISSGNANVGTIFFGDVASSTVAGFRYNHNTGDMAISAEDNITFACDNVGIGTTSPARKLHVSTGDTNVAARFENTSSNGTVVEIKTSGDSKTMILQSDHIYTNTALHLGQDSYNTYIRGANVGIRTTSPNVPLEVHGADITSSSNTTAQSVLRLVRDITDPSYTSRKDSAVDFMLSRQQAVANNLPYTRLDIRLAGTTDSSTPSLDVMSLLYNGNVGIGTTSPSYRLSVDDNSVTNIPKTLLQFDASSIADNGGYNIDFRTSSNDLANRYVARIRGIRESSGALSQLSFWTESGSALEQRMTIRASGNVGIGTTNPNAKLNVAGDVRAENSRFLAGRGTAAAPAYRFHDDGDTGMFNIASNILAFATSGSERMRVTSTGDVVIYSGQLSVMDSTGPQLQVSGWSDRAGTANNANGAIYIGNTDAYRGIIDYDASSTGSLIISNTWNNNNGDIVFKTKKAATAVEVLRLKGDGKVGIGTTSPSAVLDIVGDVVITDDTFPFIKSVTNGLSAGIRFSDQTAGYAQQGTLTFKHGDGSSYGSNASFVLGTTEATSTILADGKLMYGEGIYSKPATGTGAGTRKDSNWDTAYTYSQVGHLPLAGGTLTGDLNLTYAYPRINLTDTNHNSDYSIINNDGAFSIYDITNNSHRLSISAAGNVTFAGDLTVSGGDITLGGTGRIQGIDTVSASTDAANKAYVDAQVGSADTLQEVTDNGNTTTNSVGIGTTSVTALLNIAASSATNVKVSRIAGDTTTVYHYATLADAVLEWTCGSYHNAEVVITASQTNGGTYNNLYIRGIWSNNHTSHHWDELEHIGGLTGTTFTITNGQNGSTTNSGKLTLDVDYINGSFATLNIRITDFFGTHAYTIT